MQAVAGGQHVELQVRSDEQGAHARQAYRRRGLRTKRARAKGTVYEAASEGYELMYTERMVVRSGWEPKCGVERYENKGVPGSVLDELAAALHIHKYGSLSVRKSEEMREIKNELSDCSDCTDGMMVYVAGNHNTVRIGSYYV